MAEKKNKGTLGKGIDNDEMMIKIVMTAPNGMNPDDLEKCKTLLNHFVKEIEQELGWQVNRDQ